ncbi:helix-turn-helix domain-containing protein [Lutispora saccharofermentans]|uniref:XRE family transcriptional regulator n=1 Tax=Lutispora saccharofermentans TaxID=3024236 RepID=A0ABT1NJQ6_9FIRM|nr:XRE family transcriptional regulator [Lutispora saccharofermentans]MCQ1531500.1 XRE family transcriptional regulator [Lutispora saccharofermentans]
MLGRNIREERKNKGLTLNDVARITGFTPSYLSQIERNIIDPSLSSLRKIAQALEVPIYIFLAEDDGQHILVKANERKKLKLPNSSIVYEMLSPMSNESKDDMNMVSMYFEMEPKCWLSTEYLVHKADEFIYIIQGSADIYLMQNKYTLNEGDSLYIKQNIPHNIYNDGKDVVKGISTVSPAIF